MFQSLRGYSWRNLPLLLRILLSQLLLFTSNKTSVIYDIVETEISLDCFTLKILKYLHFSLMQTRKRLGKLTIDFLIISYGSSIHVIGNLFAKQRFINVLI